MLITVLDALVVPVRSSSILSSVAYHGMAFAASVRLSSPSCSPTSTRNTSLLTRSTRTTTALRTGHRPHRLERTSTPPAFPSSDTHTSVSMLSGVLKRARRQVATTHGAMTQTLVTALDGLSLIGILMLGTSIAQALNDYLSWTLFARPSSCHHLHRCDTFCSHSAQADINTESSVTVGAV
jgi:hypothetical protein